MRRSRRRLVVLLAGAWALGGYAAPAIANLLVNPGFEAETTAGWTPGGPGGAMASNSPAFVHDGSFDGLPSSSHTPLGQDASRTQPVTLPRPGSYATSRQLRALTIGSPSGDFDQIQTSALISNTSESGVIGGSVANFTNLRPASIGDCTNASEWAFSINHFNYSGVGPASALIDFNLQNGLNDTVSEAAGDSFHGEAVPERATLMVLESGLAAPGMLVQWWPV